MLSGCRRIVVCMSGICCWVAVELLFACRGLVVWLPSNCCLHVGDLFSGCRRIVVCMSGIGCSGVGDVFFGCCSVVFSTAIRCFVVCSRDSFRDFFRDDGLRSSGPKLNYDQDSLHSIFPLSSADLASI